MPGDIGDELRSEVARRADYRCECCLTHEDDAGFLHQVDHVVSRKHGGSSTAENLAYACVLCNRHKGADIASIDPQTGMAVRLYNPRQDRWSDDFRIEGVIINPRTEVGRVTVQLLRLNSAERIAERRILQRLGRYPPGRTV